MIIDIVRQGAPTTEAAMPNGPVTDGFGEDEEVFHVEFEPGEEPLATVVVRSVASIRDEATTDLEPLYNAVDPAVLDDLVAEGARGRVEGGRLCFTYEGLEVTVDTAGHLWFERL